jgi:hypothetical protein
VNGGSRAFNSAPSALDIYVDITDAPVWPTAHEVTMVDLDLDVVRVRATGAVEVVDEDEFAEHQVSLRLPRGRDPPGPRRRGPPGLDPQLQ